MALLNDAAALFGELLASEYAPATLERAADTYDAQGNLTRGSGASECRVQVDQVGERMVAAEGYTFRDQALYILAKPGGGLPAVDDLDTNCTVTIHSGPYAGATFKLGAPIERDPAGAYWYCRGTSNG